MKRYWLETEYNHGDFSEKKWALHEVEEEKNEIIIWRSYDETPDYPSDKEDIEGAWKAIDTYIENTLGFLPEYEVN